MKTIKKIQARRLLAQANEAEIQKKPQIANHIRRALDKQELRDNDKHYVYAKVDFKDDVQRLLWSAAFRVADFYDFTLHADEVQDIIERTAEEYIKELRVQAGNTHGVGAYEPKVPGEESDDVIIEIDEE